MAGSRRRSGNRYNRLAVNTYVLDYACREGNPTFPDKSKALAAEDTNIQSILFGSPHNIPSNRNIAALIAFSWHRCDTQPDVEITNHAVKAAKASGVQSYIASAIWCLGWTYRQLGDHRSSTPTCKKHICFLMTLLLMTWSCNGSTANVGLIL
jgi:hypothetical protein